MEANTELSFLEPFAIKIMGTTNQELWREIVREAFDACMSKSEGDVGKALDYYYILPGMIEEIPNETFALNYDSFQGFWTVHMDLVREKVAKYRNTRKEKSNKELQTLINQAFQTKTPNGCGKVMGVLKSVTMGSKTGISLLTPYLTTKEMAKATIAQVSWGNPLHASIMDAGFLINSGKLFEENQDKVLTSFDKIGSVPGFTPDSFKPVINKILDVIVKKDGATEAYNFFEKLIISIINRISLQRFSDVLVKYAIERKLKLKFNKVTEEREVINCVLSHKNPPSSVGIMTIPENVNLTTGLELLYPFIEVMSAAWLELRQDFVIITGEVFYDTKSFLKDGNFYSGIQSRILLNTDETYLTTTQIEDNAKTRSLTKGKVSSTSYCFSVIEKDIDSGDIVKKTVTIDNFLTETLNNSNIFLPNKVYITKPRIFVDESSIIKSVTTSKIASIQEAAKEPINKHLNSLLDKYNIKDGDLFKILLVEKEKELFFIGKPIHEDDVNLLLQYCKLNNGQTLFKKNEDRSSVVGFIVEFINSFTPVTAKTISAQMSLLQKPKFCLYKMSRLFSSWHFGLFHIIKVYKQKEKTMNEGKGILRNIVVGWEKIEPAVLGCLACDYNIILRGKHGTSKTVVARILAEALGKQYRHYDATKADMVVLAGIPMPSELAKGKFEYAEHEQTIWDADSLSVDEITRAPREAQNMWLSIIEEKKLYGKDLKYTFAVGTMNPSSYAATYRLDEALLDRFYAVIDVPTLFDDISNLQGNIKRMLAMTENGKTERPQEDIDLLRDMIIAIRKNYEAFKKDKTITKALCDYVADFTFELAQATIGPKTFHLSGRKPQQLRDCTMAIAAYYKTISQITGSVNILKEGGIFAAGAYDSIIYVMASALNIPLDIILPCHKKAVRFLEGLSGNEVDKIYSELSKAKSIESEIQILQKNINKIYDLAPSEIESLFKKVSDKFFINVNNAIESLLTNAATGILTKEDKHALESDLENVANQLSMSGKHFDLIAVLLYKMKQNDDSAISAIAKEIKGTLVDKATTNMDGVTEALFKYRQVSAKPVELVNYWQIKEKIENIGKFQEFVDDIVENESSLESAYKRLFALLNLDFPSEQKAKKSRRRKKK